MRPIPQRHWDLWNSGGPFIGDDRAHGRVTIQTRDSTGSDYWYLNKARSVARDSPRYPFRWFQAQDNSQLEKEVPQVISIETNAALDTDAAECTITIWNTAMDPNMTGSNRWLGDPGHFTPRRHGTKSGTARWGPLSSEWIGVLEEGQMIRTYEGWGGHGLSIPDAVEQGYLVLSGVWLIDEVGAADGKLTLKCRDMAKLLIEQMIIPPLVPKAKYPLGYKRWNGDRVITYGALWGYDKTNTLDSSPVPAEGRKFFTDVTYDTKSKGYVALGTDGGVFTRETSFYGSRGSGTAADPGPAMGIAYNPSGAGYWLAISDGTVRRFGSAKFYGDARDEVFAGYVVRIRPTRTGRGYWLFTSRGHIFNYGDAPAPPAQFPVPGSVESTQPGFPNFNEYVDFYPTASGHGFWGLTSDGEIRVVGDAVLYPKNGVAGGDVRLFETSVGIVPTRSGNGYWVLCYAGQVRRFGDAPALARQARKLNPDPTVYIAQGGGLGTAGDPMVAIARTRTGRGLITMTGNGQAWFYGDAANFGGPAEYFYGTVKVDGNYTDYTDIVADLLLWSGFQFGDGLGGLPGKEEVYGLLESTGAWAEDPINHDLFDKKSVIDGIGQIKEAVGYHFFVDAEGAARFVSPNWYRIGNQMNDGTWTRFIPEIDERVQLTSYQPQGSDRSARSEIIITTVEPYLGYTDTVTTRKALVDSRLHGMVRPAIGGNPRYLVKPEEQAAMVEIYSHHIEMTKRGGSVTCVANLAFELNDQTRVWERQARETGVHWIKSISRSHDLLSGRHLMTLQVWALPDTLPELPPPARVLTKEELEDLKWAEEEKALR